MTKIQKPDSPAQRKPPLAPNGAPRWLRPTVGVNLLARAVIISVFVSIITNPKLNNCYFGGICYGFVHFCSILAIKLLAGGLGLASICTKGNY